MRSMRPIFDAVFVLVGLTAAGSPALAGTDEPCVELRLHGKGVVQIPCPEGLDQIFELPLFRQAPEEKDDFAIVPDIPDDRDMVIDPEWPHDRGMITKPDSL
ncbi:MAG: hypothetical protein OEN55_07905 [Alphaproteobacteria bacterium]|nr:hypothetical protein [Alphaproteobacteria bacterium]